MKRSTDDPNYFDLEDGDPIPRSIEYYALNEWCTSPDYIWAGQRYDSKYKVPMRIRADFDRSEWWVLLEDIDSGVRKVVTWLNILGFHTTDSGDGVSKFGSNQEDETTLDYPHVIIVCEASEMVNEAKRLFMSLSAVDVPIGAISYDKVPCIQASYDPGNNGAIIELMHVTNEDLKHVKLP